MQPGLHTPPLPTAYLVVKNTPDTASPRCHVLLTHPKPLSLPDMGTHPIILAGWPLKETLGQESIYTHF